MGLARHAGTTQIGGRQAEAAGQQPEQAPAPNPRQFRCQFSRLPVFDGNAGCQRRPTWHPGKPPAPKSSVRRIGAQNLAQGVYQIGMIVHALRVAADAGADGQRVGLRIAGGNQTIGKGHLGTVPDDFMPRPAKTGDADADGFGGGAVIMRGGGSGQGQEGGSEDQAHGCGPFGVRLGARMTRRGGSWQGGMEGQFGQEITVKRLFPKGKQCEGLEWAPVG